MDTTVRTTNWAGNVTFGARRIVRPTSVDELRRLVAGSGRIRALGTGHSFSRVADTTGDLVSLAGLPPVIEVDPAGWTVTISGGVRYGEVASRLHAAGYALHNLGSLPHISVAGACSTGTHGSGDANRCLAAAVAALDLVTATGDVVSLRRGDADFPGAVVALGALGVLSSLTLDVQPTFEVSQVVYEGLPLAELDGSLDEVFGAAYSVSLFTRWTGPAFDQVWLKRRVEPGERWSPPRRWLGAELADGPRHPVPGMPVRHCTEQGGVPGPWHERLPHFRHGFTPSSGEELQSEYLVPRAVAVDALHAVDRVRAAVAPALQVSEIRTVAADELWASPGYGRDSVGIHFTWVPDADAAGRAVGAVEEVLTPYGARPHWGKVFRADPRTVAGRYERLADLRRLVERYDPAGTFRNDFVETYLVAD